MGRRHTGLVEQVSSCPKHMSVLIPVHRQVFGGDLRPNDDVLTQHQNSGVVRLVEQRAARRAAAAT